jgi:hypothetical protein
MADIKNYALVSNGIVVNIIRWDGIPFTAATDAAPAYGWNPPDGVEALLIPSDTIVLIGYTYSDGQFAAPLN